MEAKWKQLEKMMKKMKTANNVSLNEIGNTFTILVTFLFTKNLCTQFKKICFVNIIYICRGGS